MATAEQLYQQITNEMIDAIEASPGAWKMPWKALTSGLPLNSRTGKAYRGVNVLILGLAASRKGYTSNQWGTYKAWQEAGFQVQKGEQSTAVFLWKPTNPSKKVLAADPTAKGFLLARSYNVFNRDQTDAPALPVVELTGPERIEAAEAFFAAQGADVRVGGNQAGYAIVGDYIVIPKLEQFDKAGDYYSTLAHEHVHWTGHESRLNRDLHGRFGNEAYAMEELVAELGAAFITAQLGLDQAVRNDHASYLAHWVKVLRADSKAIVTVASRAQAAADLLTKTAGTEPAVETAEPVAEPDPVLAGLAELELVELMSA